MLTVFNQQYNKCGCQKGTHVQSIYAHYINNVHDYFQTFHRTTPRASNPQPAGKGESVGDLLPASSRIPHMYRTIDLILWCSICAI